MLILAHRGFWNKKNPKNSLAAFGHAFELGCGIELDVRDFGRRLVVSHNPPIGNELSLKDVFELYNKFKIYRPWLAINIKSDGISEMLKKTLQRYRIKRYFVFDMSVPDTFTYLKNKMNVFCRYSDFEPISDKLLDRCKGVWIDCFGKNKVPIHILKSVLLKGLFCCVVSPELHGCEHKIVWKKCHFLDKMIKTDRLMICTDYPDKAKEFFK